MKKIKLALIFTTILSTMFTIGIQPALAWSSPGNKTAFSVGTDYKSGILDFNAINTTEDAQYAHNIYSSMYWKSVLITEPTSSNMVKKHSNGYYYFESSIVFLAGHGAAGGMSWNYKGKGGSHSVNIVSKQTRDYTLNDGSISIGLGRFNASQNDLVVYAGCETAKGSSNMTKTIVEQGATTAIGWAVSTKTGSHTNWSKRFNDKLKEKKSVKEAAEYADSFNYQDNGVKNYVIEGDKYFILGSNYEIASISSSNESQNQNEYVINKNVITNDSKISEEDIRNNIEKNIKETINSDFDVSDYKVEVNGIDGKIYDYVLYIDGARTDLGYTVKVKDNKILTIFDNTNGINVETLKKSVNKKVIKDAISTKNVSSALNNAIAKAKQEYEGFSTDYVDSVIYLDTKENKLYKNTSIKVTDQFGYHSIVTYSEVIK